MTGDRLIQIYGEIHDQRATHNTAVSKGERPAALMARAKLRDLQAVVDYHLRDPAPETASTYN